LVNLTLHQNSVIYVDNDLDWNIDEDDWNIDDDDDLDWIPPHLTPVSTSATLESPDTTDTSLAVVKWTPTLIRDTKQTSMDTLLYTDTEKNPKSVWTLFHAPANTLFPHPDHSPTTALVVRPRLDQVRRMSTIDYIHKHTAKYTVGPATFCGHARLIENGTTKWVEIIFIFE
jgi:hypothetical protein